jgi:hypothetical protein
VIGFIGASTGIKNSRAARWDKTSRAVVPGAACLTPYLAFAAPERISRDPRVRHKAAPLQALGTNGLWQRAKPFEDEGTFRRVIRFIGASTGIKNSRAARWDKTSCAVVPGAACLIPYLAFAAPERISRDPRARPKAAPLQALGNYVSHQRANRFEDEDEYEWAGGCAYSSDSASPPAA